MIHLASLKKAVHIQTLHYFYTQQIVTRVPLQAA